MCGIAAIVSPFDNATLRSIRPMTRLIRHRGPDDAGFAFFGEQGPPAVFADAETPAAVRRAELAFAPREEFIGEVPAGAAVALGHRRLSIVDLSPAGHQPMCEARGRYWIVFNGEIYNHVELRAELESRGHQFVSRTDTEVILAAYAEWGEACQQRFNGMWGLVIYDAQTGTLFASRDRFGVKPLYYTVVGGKVLAIASEIKQFTAIDGWTPRVDWQRGYEFLAWGLSDHAQETFFDGVRQVPPGGCFSIAARQWDGRLPEIRRWYGLPRGEQRIGMTEAAEKLSDLLADSVRLRLRADVSVGSCLSGGIDSSSLVCLMNKQLRGLGKEHLQEAVSSCSEIAKYDERPFIEQVVERTGVKVHYVFPNLNDLLPSLENLAWHQDGPFGSTSIFAQWNVFAEARQRGLIVMLDGQGADEQLAGYHDFYGAWLAELLMRMRWSRLRSETAAVVQMHGYSRRSVASRLARHLPMPTALKLLLRKHLGGARTLIHDVLTPGAFDQLGTDRSAAARLAYHDAATIHGKSHLQLSVTNLPQLLRYEDRNSMAHSIESRVPFLDYRVVEHTVTLPGELKIRGGRTKDVLRRAMSGVLPSAIVGRTDKMAFVTPEAAWCAGEGAETFRSAVIEACRTFPQLFDERKGGDAVDAVVAGRRPYDASLWRLASFGAWSRRFEAA